MKSFEAAASAEPFQELEEARIALNLDRIRNVFRPSADQSRKIVIFGTGALGHLVARAAQYSGLEICAASDNSEPLWHSDFAGVPVLPPREAVARFGATAIFVVAIFNPTAVLKQLREYGCSRVATYPSFYWVYADFFEGITGLARPEYLLAHRAELSAAYATLADDASRTEFAAQVAWRCTLDDSRLPNPSPSHDMHFDSNVYELTNEETLVDCGAFDGDSLRAFLERARGLFRRAYALEPDPLNRARLKAYVESLPSTKRTAVRILPFAAADRNGTVRFDAGLGVASNAKDSGTVELPCRRLDDIGLRSPTIIKMDIEGSELLALRGAINLIQCSRPVLSVCAYHYCAHLWELPLLLNTLAPDSSLFLRRYAEQCWETVYYAVPRARLAANQRHNLTGVNTIVL